MAASHIGIDGTVAGGGGGDCGCGKGSEGGGGGHNLSRLNVPFRTRMATRTGPAAGETTNCTRTDSDADDITSGH